MTATFTCAVIGWRAGAAVAAKAIRKASPEGEREENRSGTGLWPQVSWLLPTAVDQGHGEDCCRTQGARLVQTTHTAHHTAGWWQSHGSDRRANEAIPAGMEVLLLSRADLSDVPRFGFMGAPSTPRHPTQALAYSFRSGGDIALRGMPMTATFTCAVIGWRAGAAVAAKAIRKASPEGEREENRSGTGLWPQVSWLLPTAVDQGHGEDCCRTQGARLVQTTHTAHHTAGWWQSHGSDRRANEAIPAGMEVLLLSRADLSDVPRFGFMGAPSTPRHPTQALAYRDDCLQSASGTGGNP